MAARCADCCMFHCMRCMERSFSICAMRRRSLLSSKHLAKAGVPGFAPVLRQAASSLAAMSAALMQALSGSATAAANRSFKECVFIWCSPQEVSACAQSTMPEIARLLYVQFPDAVIVGCGF